MEPEAIVNAREEHLEEIRVLIESWLKVRSEPPSVRDINNQYTKWKLIYESYPFKFLPPELFHNPLFESLKEHIPDEELWQGFEIWNSSLTDYLGKCFQLIEKLGKLVAKFSDCERTDDFIKPVFSQLDYFQKFRVWPDALVFHTRKNEL